MTACIAPPGSWCNESKVISHQPVVNISGHLRADEVFRAVIALVPPEERAADCCCAVCSAACASSPSYSCAHCTGAATAGCAQCYYDALRFAGMNGSCTSPPPPALLPSSPTPPAPPSPPPRAPSAEFNPPNSTRTQSTSYPGGEWLFLTLSAGFSALGLIVGITFIFTASTRAGQTRRRAPSGRARDQTAPHRAPPHAEDEPASSATDRFTFLPTRIVAKAEDQPSTSTRDATQQPQDAADVDECPICLAELAPGEVAVQLPCGHANFHASCIKMWLRSKPACPLCKAAVRQQTSCVV